MILALPIIMTADYLLHIWLGVVPEHAATFARLVLLFTMSESLATPLVTVMLATGKIRNYQLVVGGCQLFNLPVSYFLLRLGNLPETIFVVAIAVSVLCEMIRLIMLRGMINLPVRLFLRKVYLNVIIVTVISAICPYIMKGIIGIDSFGSFVLVFLISAVSAILFIYIIGCNKHDKETIHKAINKVINRIK